MPSSLGVPFGERGGAVLRPGVGIDQHPRRAVERRRGRRAPTGSGGRRCGCRNSGRPSSPARRTARNRTARSSASRSASRPGSVARKALVTAFCASTQALTSASCADVILEPAIGIGDRHAELRLDQVGAAGLRIGERRLRRSPARGFPACSSSADRSGSEAGVGGVVTAQALVSNATTSKLRRMKSPAGKEKARPLG